jgi:proteasome lid subunit RPN8/RPN11
MIFTPEELAQVRAQAEAEYPAECCGVLLTREGAPADRLLFLCRNIQDELHAKDPVRHPRDSSTAYFIDPKDLLTIGRHEAQGYRVAIIHHSHIDAGAYFSPTDKRNALIDGEPAYPGALYVVLSVAGGTVVGSKAFAWDSHLRDFVPPESDSPELTAGRSGGN